MKNAKNTKTLDGYTVKFTRRRYGDQTFTWAHVLLNGEWVSLGDPWQAVTPARSDLLQAIKRVEKPSCGFIGRILGRCSGSMFTIRHLRQISPKAKTFWWTSDGLVGLHFKGMYHWYRYYQDKGYIKTGTTLKPSGTKHRFEEP